MSLAASAAASEGPEAGDPNQIFDPALYAALEFRMIGPHRGGRSTAVAGVPSEMFTFYMGATGGGVWKTTNAGLSWRNVSDGYFGTASIGAIAVADSDPNVVYVGTGSACPRGNVMTGDGVYRSTDAGESWQHAGLPDAGLIGRIRVHPRDPDRAWVAVLGRIFGESDERGVYRTTDGGQSWEPVLQVSRRTGAVDLAIDPGNPRNLYAALWQAERKPWTLIDGGEESGLYRSTDGGDSWTRLEEGLPRGELGRIAVAVSPARPERVWALVGARDGEGGLFRSEDRGESWERVSEDRELQTRGWYYTHLTADPQDPDTVYTMNVRFWKSIDGGRSFERIPTPHGDNHDLWIHPDHPSVMIEANDGGGTITLDGGDTWSSIYNQPTAEFYRLTVDDRFPYRAYGAQQDNSSISVPAWSEGGTSAEGDWWIVPGGESGHIGLHPGNPDLTYAGNYIGTIIRHDRATGESRNVILYPELADGVAPRDLEYRFQWNAPIRVSPHDPETVYHASNYVHRSRDRGMSWETISPDLTRDDPGRQELPGGPIQHDDTGVEVYNTIFALEESPLTPGELWAGTDDGRLHLSRDDGATWTEVTPADLAPDTTINTLELSVHAPGRVFFAAHRYRLDDYRPLIYRTDDFGASWTQLADGRNGIPDDHPVRVVREDPALRGLLFAGTELGLFLSFDDGAHWQPLGLDFPVAQVADLAVKDDDLVVATHGRSFWVLDDIGPLRELTPEVAQSPLHFYAPRRTEMVASGGFDEGPEPDRRPTGALLHFYLAETPETDGRLEIADASGEVLRSIVLRAEGAGDDDEDEIEVVEVDAGMNRVLWDFRTDKPELVKGAIMSLGYTGGTTVPPGDYQVTVAFGEETQSRSLELLNDPRLGHLSQEDLDEGYRLALAARARMVEIHDAVRAIRSLESQFSDLLERLEEAEIAVTIEDRMDAVSAQLDELEEELIQTRNEARQDPLNFPPKLDNQYSYLYGQLDRSRGRPTAGSHRRLQDLDALWEPLKARMQTIVDEGVAAINEELAEAEVPAILVPVASSPGDGR